MESCSSRGHRWWALRGTQELGQRRDGQTYVAWLVLTVLLAALTIGSGSYMLWKCLTLPAAVRVEVSPVVCFAVACVGAWLIWGRQRVSNVALTSLPESVARR